MTRRPCSEKLMGKKAKLHRVPMRKTFYLHSTKPCYGLISLQDLFSSGQPRSSSCAARNLAATQNAASAARDVHELFKVNASL